MYLIKSGTFGLLVMPGLVPGIHVFAPFIQRKTWMAGTKPGHDENKRQANREKRKRRCG